MRKKASNPKPEGSMILTVVGGVFTHDPFADDLYALHCFAISSKGKREFPWPPRVELSFIAN